MFTKSYEITKTSNPSAPKEGDLFKIIEHMGQRFEIRYGYYEEKDRKFDPMPIYPDLDTEPVYTDDGIPFVTAMQHPCKYFRGNKDENSACGDCSYYEKYEELLGFCICGKNQRSTDGEGRNAHERSTNKA